MSQPQGESTLALLAALTSQLQSMTVQPNISAVSLKLPEFWTTSPEVWFARVEAQFAFSQARISVISKNSQKLLTGFGRHEVHVCSKLSTLPIALLLLQLQSKLSPGLDFSLSVALDPKPHQHLSGRSYLVDTGAEVSVYPASVQERKSQPPSSTLTAANGTSIHTWGKRKVFLAIGQKGQYQHEFYLADVTRSILGADFFIKHGLAIDLRGKRLLFLDNMSILLRETKSPLTLSGLGFPLKHEYDSLLQQFPELLTQHFHQCNNKHGVEHHIITQGPPNSFAST
ncbi:transposon ty3-g gap-pol polyprotein [Plakobranchus ocellatus]|uniref:Transposon ty3-g gap-pol polyprotein n=1 Tax=Plakobranchus ocellatus TaxID=259542 RepID=A0AAV4CWQ2_9GAST|nr:transposon ty3-g gap-pol polyprotein [Plakobranchus ocellatus]